MKDELDIDIDELETEEGSKFDMRKYEMELFAEMYTKLLNLYTVYTNNRERHEVGRLYFSVAKTMINSFKKYVRHDEELYETLEEVEDNLVKLKNNCNEVEKRKPSGVGTVTLVGKADTEDVDNVKTVIEEMRDEGNLKMPKKSSTNEDRAWEQGK